MPDPSVDGAAELALGARFSYARKPLVLQSADSSQQIVTHQLLAHALLAVELARRFELSLDAPFVVSQDGRADDRFESPSGAAIGDLRLGTRATLLPAQGRLPAAALELELWLPTGEGDYASYSSARYAAAAIVGSDFDSWLWRARFGARYRRDDSEAAGLFGSEAHAGVGIGLPWHKALFGLELVGATAIEQSPGWFSDNATHLEALVSAKYRFGPLTALLGAGPGLSIGAGTPAYRVVAGIEIAHELAPEAAGGASVADRDGDRVPPDRSGTSRRRPADTHERATRTLGDPRLRAYDFRSQIVIREQIRFATGKDELLPESFRVLGDVAQLLGAHPEIARVSVDGHTDDVGDDATNLTLSRRRALAVVRWLVAHGIDERRLEARGFGARQPLVAESSERARSQNRRVEFWIKRRSPLGKRGWRDGAAR